ncbi:MAG: NADH-quinone oxidoreductase subunit L [Trueperaceae bacterium]|nr:NADH-quinone oxidoreductase subunit L [Trueperaceae bacterium]
MSGGVDLFDLAQKEREEQATYRRTVLCCGSTACLSGGAQATQDAIRDAVAEKGLEQDVRLVATGCMGLCSRGPLVKVRTRGEDDVLYADVDADAGRRIAEQHLTAGQPVEDKALSLEHPFFARQVRVVLENMGEIDPNRIEDYIAHGGYRALRDAVNTMTPAGVIDVVQRSGLRGRGGGGYPAGSKWKLLNEAKSDQKTIIANGDEGDPGAYMDRTVMEDDPHRVLEGMAIAAYATGAVKGYIYVRAEYPVAVRRLEQAIRQAKRHKLLGKNLFDTDFSFDVEIRIGAGAFVCGEETALMASIMGQRGTPVLRPPYPTERGLWGQPSMINNVETLANVPTIMRRGADWFASIGTDSSRGTKVFALAGKLDNTGLIEVPMGITLREIIEEIGGGVAGGKAFKAAQTGGPSGGCIPLKHIDTPMDYDSLLALGSIMGSGGLIVMDEDVAMPEVARFFMRFCMDESCGKCLPCRAGTYEMHELLDALVTGRGTAATLARLETLCEVVRTNSLCGLGQTAPNPVLSTLHYFRPEYEALLVPDGAHLAGLPGAHAAAAADRASASANTSERSA